MVGGNKLGQQKQGGNDMERDRLEQIAAALYDGGWRSREKKYLQLEHNFTEEEATIICKTLRRWEIDDLRRVRM